VKVRVRVGVGVGVEVRVRSHIGLESLILLVRCAYISHPSPSHVH